MTIQKIKAREILDSRGEPTVEVDLETEAGWFRASAPSGASTGKYEALELRDEEQRYQGRGVQQAVQNVNDVIVPELEGEQVGSDLDQVLLELDGTANKSKLGANAILPVSIAACKAGAAAEGIPVWKYIQQQFEIEEVRIPQPSFNIINGGVHAGNELSVQEFMILPSGESFKKQLRKGAEIYHQLEQVLKNKFGPSATNVGDEGGFAPPLRKTTTALDLIEQAIEKQDCEVELALDCAASEFHQKQDYKLEGSVFTHQGLLEFYQSLVEQYNLVSLEDPFAEEDWGGFSRITEQLEGVNIVGDDLLVTNTERIEKAHRREACNTLLLKPNQVGTVTEAIEAAKLAYSFDWEVMVSHRSGETCDSFLADLAVGIGAEFIKAGAPARGERVAKYNQLLRIEEEL